MCNLKHEGLPEGLSEGLQECQPGGPLSVMSKISEETGEYVSKVITKDGNDCENDSRFSTFQGSEVGGEPSRKKHEGD